MSELNYIKQESLNYLIARGTGEDSGKHVENIAKVLFDAKYNSRMESLSKVKSKVERALLHKKEEHLSFSINKDNDNVEYDPKEIEWSIERSWPKRRVAAHDNS